jgi:hypothetical protein
MPTLFAEAMAARDRTLTDELEAELLRLPLDRRAVIRLRSKGIIPAGLPQLAWRELVNLTMFQLAAEHAVITTSAVRVSASKAGRPANSMAHNLILAAALEIKGAPTAAAIWLGHPITAVMVLKARAALTRQAIDFVALLRAEATGHDVYLRRRLDEMRQVLSIMSDQREADRVRRVRDLAPPSRRHFYNPQDSGDATSPKITRNNPAAPRIAPADKSRPRAPARVLGPQS